MPGSRSSTKDKDTTRQKRHASELNAHAVPLKKARSTNSDSSRSSTKSDSSRSKNPSAAALVEEYDKERPARYDLPKGGAENVERVTARVLEELERRYCRRYGHGGANVGAGAAGGGATGSAAAAAAAVAAAAVAVAASGRAGGTRVALQRLYDGLRVQKTPKVQTAGQQEGHCMYIGKCSMWSDLFVYSAA